ncbi:MAG: UDP-N-acetylmuramoyl-L-alanyl-D-glutamate--2,6-diaminopimelate ligase [Thermodesulfobacteriota bacterium]|nr:UDP-N-acetylmuramoyl-L-alanyl-D-glutamate--2,6-diaminopimelate ligase [Thermodesulfobacteriota bacterium]
MKELANLLNNIEYRTFGNQIEGIKVTAVTADSRKVRGGTLFVAVAGLTVDGHEFVQDAIDKGCVAVVVQRGLSGSFAGRVCVIEVADSSQVLGELAAAFFDYPARWMQMIGITGTNGKTTSTYLLETLVKTAGGEPGIIGTVNYRYGVVEYEASHTTPEPVALQKLLREMADHGVTHVVMEVSSHALKQKRINGLFFDVALFTNLSRDHLDFHGNMIDYYSAKKELFSYLKDKGRAVVVLSGGEEVGESSWGEKLLQELQEDRNEKLIISCGIKKGQVHGRNFHFSLSGTGCEVVTPAGNFQLQSELIGEFNLRNLLGVSGVGIALGVAPKTIAKSFSRAGAIPGRLERVQPSGSFSRQDITVFVDYAHTPDALENVLATLRNLQPGRLIVVFGCGGDRDRGKRPEMGEIAGRLADVVLLTSDNPRSEDPDKILTDIEEGLRRISFPNREHASLLRSQKERGYDIISSRHEAIRAAIRNGQAGDVILISGKGHEQYQITSAGKTFFDDRQQAREQLDKRFFDSAA